MKRIRTISEVRSRLPSGWTVARKGNWIEFWVQERYGPDWFALRINEICESTFDDLILQGQCLFDEDER